jgi:hypothetical protein
MFAVPHSDINSFNSGLLHFTSRPHCKKSRLAKVKDGIINFILGNYLVDRNIGPGPNTSASILLLFANNILNLILLSLPKLEC